MVIEWETVVIVSTTEWGTVMIDGTTVTTAGTTGTTITMAIIMVGITDIGTDITTQEVVGITGGIDTPS